MRCFVLSGNEDGISADPVHVNAYARLEVVEVNESKLGHEVNDSVELRYLDGNREVGCRLRWEKHVDSFFLERRIGRSVVDLNDVKLMISI